MAASTGLTLTYVLCLCLLPAAVSSDVSDVVQGIAALSAAIAAGRHVRRCHDGRSRTTWALIAAGCASWALGEAYWCWHTLRADVVPFPSLADAGFLGFSVLMAAGLLLHPARDGRIGFLQRMLDGVLTAGAVGLVSWLTTLSAVADADHGVDGLERFLLLAYPSADVLLVVFAVLLLVRTGGARPALYLVSGGVLCLGISDSAFAYLGAMGLYDGGWIDLGWIAGFLAIALAGSCPEASPEPLRRRASDDAQSASVPASVLPYIPVLAALSVVVVVTLKDRPLSTPEMLVACGIVLCLLARQYLAVRDNVRLARELASRERQMRRQAFSDSLTGLANRALFSDRLEHALELHERDRRPVGIIFLDLDDFKAVNDAYGHAAGDELLMRVAERIAGATRVGDTVARLGGDEFAVLLEDAAEPLRTATRIRDALKPAITFAGAEHLVRASVGLAVVTADEPPVTADVLLGRSDAAMYAAKRAGKATIARFDTTTGAIVEPEGLLPAHT